VAHERGAEQSAVRQKARDDLVIAEAHVRQSGIAVGPGGLVEHGAGTESLGEPTQFTGRDLAFPKVGIVHHDAPLAEEPDGRAGRRRVVRPEQLDVRHPLGRLGGQRRGHA
jgi:hypothetical protein